MLDEDGRTDTGKIGIVFCESFIIGYYGEKLALAFCLALRKIRSDLDETKCWGCRFCASFDKGRTWTEPREIADSSVTPHIVTLANDDSIIVCYNDLRYPDKNGVKTKAVFVRKIKVTRR